jgi:hypothetical protein
VWQPTRAWFALWWNLQRAKRTGSSDRSCLLRSNSCTVPWYQVRVLTTEPYSTSSLKPRMIASWPWESSWTASKWWKV